MGEPWDGDERRGIPIHVLNYVGEQMESHTKEVKDAFASHEKEELIRYKVIQDDIGEIRKSLHTLMTNINAFMEQTTEFHGHVKSAFPKDDENRPDYTGHNKAHKSWIATAEQDKEVMTYVRQHMKKENEGFEDKRIVVRSILITLLSIFAGWVIIQMWSAAVINAEQKYHEKVEKAEKGVKP